MMSEFAPAKINLTLKVGSAYPAGHPHAGYHPLNSLVLFADQAGDRLHATAAEAMTLSITGPFAEGLDSGRDNLVMRAADLLVRAGQPAAGASIILEKHLPVASGIGGGSADAAATLRLLRRLWSLEIDDDALARLAVPLGADVPACVASAPCRMTGIGITVTPLERPVSYEALLVNPGISVPTPVVYQQFDAMVDDQEMLADRFEPERSEPLTLPGDSATLGVVLGQQANDLEEAATRTAPDIGRVLAALRALPTCAFAGLSGSGATCFGVFQSAEAASQAARQLTATLADQVPRLWLQPTRLGSGL